MQQTQCSRSVPPLARLATLLANVGALSDSPPAAELLTQKQLQHELQQLLMQRLAAAQREGRAVAIPRDSISEAVEREETLATLHGELISLCIWLPCSLPVVVRPPLYSLQQFSLGCVSQPLLNLCCFYPA